MNVTGDVVNLSDHEWDQRTCGGRCSECTYYRTSDRATAEKAIDAMVRTFRQAYQEAEPHHVKMVTGPSFHDDELDAKVAYVLRGYLRAMYQKELGDDFDEVEFKSMLADFEGREMHLYHKICYSTVKNPRNIG